jgi:putative ABC transport system ATP-binding protein
MNLFRRLNTEGMTIVLVTHDPGIAAQAQRAIHVRDGCIVNNGNGHEK